MSPRLHPALATLLLASAGLGGTPSVAAVPGAPPPDPTAACYVQSLGPYNVAVLWTEVKGVRGVLVTNGTDSTRVALDKPTRTGNYGFAGLDYEPTAARLLGRASEILKTVACINNTPRP